MSLGTPAARETAPTLPRALLLAQAWAELGDGVAPLSNASGRPPRRPGRRTPRPCPACRQRPGGLGAGATGRRGRRPPAAWSIHRRADALPVRVTVPRAPRSPLEPRAAREPDPPRLAARFGPAEFPLTPARQWPGAFTGEAELPRAAALLLPPARRTPTVWAPASPPRARPAAPRGRRPPAAPRCPGTPGAASPSRTPP